MVDVKGPSSNRVEEVSRRNPALLAVSPIGKGFDSTNSPGRVRVLFGSETGNAQRVAERLAAEAVQRGLDVQCSRMNDVAPTDLGDGAALLVVTSTTDEGDVPYNAERFWSSITVDSAPRLEGVRFAVLALGDSDYFDFCQAGIDIDDRLASLGASRLRPLLMCDVDFETEASKWTHAILEKVAGPLGPFSTPRTTVRPAEPSEIRVDDPRFEPARTCLLTVDEIRKISGTEALKDVWHLRLAIEGTSLEYSAGDSLRIAPRNDPTYVEAFLSSFDAAGDAKVRDQSLRDRLLSQYEIARPSRELVDEVANRTENLAIRKMLDARDRDALHQFLWSRDILDIISLADREPFKLEEVLTLLRPLSHRSYSIASSPLTSPDHIDITVAALRYRVRGRDRGGVGSTFLADRVSKGDKIEGFVDRNERFRPPADGDRPMIMVGPGTGVAPFRAFLQERRARGAGGRNWLFFGARTRRHDYLYEGELSAMERDRLLTRLDVAFSRDEEAVYVQHRMREHGAQLFQWLQEGANFYVCGDAARMAGDVDATLRQIVAEHGRLSADEAAAYIDELSRNSRYLRDVY